MTFDEAVSYALEDEAETNMAGSKVWVDWL